MAASADMVKRLRRMIAEPTVATYSDAELVVYIESYPLHDLAGNASDHDDWTARYDLNHAAAEIWGEKAGAPTQDFDFHADGGVYQRSQVYEQCMKQARYYASRKAVGSVKVHVEPQPVTFESWIGNLAEED